MSIPDGSTPADRFGADVSEMEGAAKQTNYLAAKLSTELYPPVLQGVEQTVRVNMGLPGFSTMAEFFNAAVRTAVNQVAQDFTSQAEATQKGAAAFQLTDDNLRAQAARIPDGLSPTPGPEVA